MWIAGSVIGVCASELADTRRAGDLDLRATELSVVEEKSCLSGGLFLESDCCALRAVGGLGGWSNGEGGDLAANLY